MTDSQTDRSQARARAKSRSSDPPGPGGAGPSGLRPHPDGVPDPPDNAETPQKATFRNQLGADGESLVAQWYVDRGYEVVDRNWRTRAGEVDLIVSRGPTIVFCEVKTRSSNAFGGPFAAVGEKKQARLRTLALEWIDQNSPRRGFRLRFDVAGVMDGEVEVIFAAF